MLGRSGGGELLRGDRLGRESTRGHRFSGIAPKEIRKLRGEVLLPGWFLSRAISKGGRSGQQNEHIDKVGFRDGFRLDQVKGSWTREAPTS